jgi:hypothetical protein
MAFFRPRFRDFDGGDTAIVEAFKVIAHPQRYKPLAVHDEPGVVRCPFLGEWVATLAPRTEPLIYSPHDFHATFEPAD